MHSRLLNILRNLYHRFEFYKISIRDWFLAFSRKPHADGWLAFFSFAEASFFPVPPDFLQIALTLAHGARWFWYAAIATALSVLGGAFGYIIGAGFFEVLGEPLIAFYNLEEEMAHAARAFSEYSFWTIFVAAFTPIPYKVFTIAGGFFSVNMWIFLIASAAGRGMRFFAIGFLAARYGEKLRYLIYRYFNIASFALVLLIVLGLILL